MRRGILRLQVVPNQRARNKVYLGGFIERKFYAEIRRAARMAGMASNVFGFGMSLIQDPLSRRPDRLKEAGPRQRSRPK